MGSLVSTSVMQASRACDGLSSPTYCIREGSCPAHGCEAARNGFLHTNENNAGD